LGVEWKWAENIKSAFNWFYSRLEDENTTYSNKAWFNGQGAAPGTLIPSIDPSKPYSIDGNGGNRLPLWRTAETATLYQACFERQQFSVLDFLR
jgi:hypothetical protein